MNPGGKKHIVYTEDQKKAGKKCLCEYCRLNREADAIDVGELRKQLEAAKEEKKRCTENQREAGQLLRTVELRTIVRARPFDPVFSKKSGIVRAAGADDDPSDDEDGYDHELREEAMAEWNRVKTSLTPSDFPMKLIFLDKSGSMGFNETTYELLLLAMENSMKPTVGSNLVFFMAGPGDTQVFLRRPGDAPANFDFEFGGATWFNEPIPE